MSPIEPRPMRPVKLRPLELSPVRHRRRLRPHEHAAALHELVRTREELEHLAYAVSHDLNEPLRMVLGYTRLLQRRLDGAMDSETREFTEYVVRGAERLRRMMDDLLAYSRWGRMRDPLELVNLNEALDHVHGLLKSEMEQRGLSLFRSSLPTVLGDHSALVQLLYELMDNAVQASVPVSTMVQVDARRCADRAAWCIRVSDEGRGIDPRSKAQVFRMFQRVHPHDPMQGGTGAGLAICRRIVERHGGQMGLLSTLGLGSSFWFTLADQPPRPVRLPPTVSACTSRGTATPQVRHPRKGAGKADGDGAGGDGEGGGDAGPQKRRT